MTGETVAGVLEHTDSIFVGGEWARPSGKARIDVINPYSEALFVSVAGADGTDIDRAVIAARVAFDHGPWPRLSHAERAVYLRAIGQGLHARADKLAHAWTSEVGVISGVSMAMMQALGGVFEYYASLAESFPFVERHQPQAGGEIGLLVREPVGPVAAIVPWNFPASLAAYKVAPALIAGCSVVLKMSPEAPTAGYVLAEVAREIGLPPGVLNVLTADREASELLVRHPGIDKVSFTGSSAVGKRIASICSERLARCTLELGGKSAAVVLEDFDVDVAAAAIAEAAPVATGQVCAALTRIIVPRSRHDAFVDALASRFAAVTVGNPFDAATGMGPLATAVQRDRVEGYIASGIEQGARLATGGNRPAHLPRGYFVEPTVFAEVENGMRIAREEIFGPVLCVLPAADEAEALAIANDSPFGLNAAVFTNDTDRALRAARRLRSGTVGHNGFRADFSIAFGGFKESGIGREGGKEGLLPYLETKTVILDGQLANASA
jgi:aldehyde dehydrogenase (NAD+)